MRAAIWLRRATIYVVTAAMLAFGLTSIASAQSITNTGPGSHNVITTTTNNSCQVTNNNNVDASNSNTQTANSGNATESDNTTAGLPWSGWSTLDPAVAQADGMSYSAWWSQVVGWISARATGAGWNSTDTNLSWAPSGNTWASFDPMVWQANGQSFNNWFVSVESYLNSNSSAWLLSWPSSDTGSGSLGGATTGNATNNFNDDFTINIDNAAAAAAGTNACGQSNFTPPTIGGGMGGGPTGSAITTASIYAPRSSGGKGGYGGGSAGIYASSYLPTPITHSSYVAPAPQTTPSSLSSTQAVTTPSVTQASTAPPQSSISNTGPCSTNEIASATTSNTTVANTNNVSIVSTNTQTATTGNSTSADNTTTGGGSSGNATNVGSAGVDAGIDN